MYVHFYLYTFYDLTYLSILYVYTFLRCLLSRLHIYFTLLYHIFLFIYLKLYYLFIYRC